MLPVNSFNPDASKPSLLTGLKPPAPDVNGLSDRRAVRPGFYEEVVPPHMRTPDSVKPSSDVADAKTETGTDPSSKEALEAKGYTQVDAISADRAAGNILNFVRQGLAQAASRGKSEEELQTMLDQARQGVEQGYTQALSELEDLGLMNEELAEKIQASRDLVEKGLNDLEAEFFGKAPAPVENEVEAPKSAPTSPIGRATQAYQSARLEEQSMQLKLQTREGDVITLLWGSSSSESYSMRQGDGFMSFSSKYAQSSQLQYSIVGDLNEEERADLDALLNASFEFAGKFFAGNEEIMQDAMAYVEAFSGFDSMSSLDLRLSYSKIERTSAYTDLSQLGQLESPESAPKLPDAVEGELKTLQDLADKALADQQDARNLFQQLPELLGATAEQGNQFMKLMDSFFGHSGFDAAA